MTLTMSKPQEYTIRELMPRGYTKILRKRTGKAASYITLVVNEERKSSPIWQDVLALAEQTKTALLAEAALKSKPAA
jgi:hypothetical protein